MNGVFVPKHAKMYPNDPVNLIFSFQHLVVLSVVIFLAIYSVFSGYTSKTVCTLSRWLMLSQKGDAKLAFVLNNEFLNLVLYSLHLSREFTTLVGENGGGNDRARDVTGTPKRNLRLNEDVRDVLLLTK